MITSRYIYQIPKEEWEKGKNFMQFELHPYRWKSPIRSLLWKAIEDFEAGKFSYDGATFVKDLCDLPKLDIDAMLHDYECLIGANRNFIKWFKSAWKFFENMRKNGKGNQIFRFVLVCLAGFVFVPYCAIFTPKYYPIKK